MHGNDVVLSHEDIDFAGTGDAIGLIEDRELHHNKQMIVILIQLWTLGTAHNVIDFQRVKAEIVGQILSFGLGGSFDVDPGKPPLGDGLNPQFMIFSDSQRSGLPFFRDSCYCITALYGEPRERNVHVESEVRLTRLGRSLYYMAPSHLNS